MRLLTMSGSQDAGLSSRGRRASLVQAFQCVDMADHFVEDERIHDALIAENPDIMRSVFEWSLIHRSELARVDRAAIFDDLGDYIAGVLEAVGDADTASLLRPYADDPALGEAAVRAIRTIEGRSAIEAATSSGRWPSRCCPHGDDERRLSPVGRGDAFECLADFLRDHGWAHDFRVELALTEDAFLDCARNASRVQVSRRRRRCTGTCVSRASGCLGSQTPVADRDVRILMSRLV